MNAADRLAFALGSALFKIEQLRDELAAAQAKIAELESKPDEEEQQT